MNPFDSIPSEVIIREILPFLDQVELVHFGLTSKNNYETAQEFCASECRKFWLRPENQNFLLTTPYLLPHELRLRDTLNESTSLDIDRPKCMNMCSGFGLQADFVRREKPDPQLRTHPIETIRNTSTSGRYGTKFDEGLQRDVVVIKDFRRMRLKTIIKNVGPGWYEPSIRIRVNKVERQLLNSVHFGHGFF